MSGRLLHSPEPILYAATSISCRWSAASRENGVDRYVSPSASAWALSSRSWSQVRVQRLMMSQIDTSAFAGTTSLGTISSAGEWDWNFTTSAPAAAASSIMRRALPMSPSWLIPISGITKGAWAAPMRRPPIDISGAEVEVMELQCPICVVLTRRSSRRRPPGCGR